MNSARRGELLLEEDLADPDTTADQFDTEQEDRDPVEEAQNSSVFDNPIPPLESLYIPDAGRLVEQLLSVHQGQGEQAAIDRLLQIMASPEMENLEARDDFEVLLAKAVSQMERKPYMLLAKVVDLFNIEGRSGLINSKLTYWHSSLLIHLETARCYARLLQTAATKRQSPGKASARFTILPLDAPTEDQIFAAQILTGPFDQHKFRSIARRRRKRKLVLGLLKRLKTNYPDAVRHALDPQVVSWWEALTAVRIRRADNTLMRLFREAPPIVIISWLIAMLVYEFTSERLYPPLLMAGAVLITIAGRLGWEFYLKKTRVAHRLSRIWKSLLFGRSR